MDLQRRLTEAFTNRNINDFKEALCKGGNPCELDDNYQCIYEKCLETPQSAEYIIACLENGCSVNYVNKKWNRTAIDYVKNSRCLQNLKTVLYNTAFYADGIIYASLTPHLNSLSKSLTNENATEVYECMKLLLAYGVSPNIPDRYGSVPLHHVLLKDNLSEGQRFVELLLEQTDLDIDRYLIQLLKDKYPDLPLKKTKSSMTLEQLTFLLRIREEQIFAELLLSYKSTAGGDQMIRICVENGLGPSFDLLLKSSLVIDINLTYGEPKITLVELAIDNGNWYALDQLLKHKELKLHPEMLLLIRMVHTLNEPLSQVNYCDYKKCFDILLENERVPVDEIDDCDCTALHYAALHQQDEAVKKLLAKGACLAQPSVLNDLPVDDIDAELLEEHFNECIRNNGTKRSFLLFQVVIDYKNLGSNQGLRFLEYLAQSEHLLHLLKHPLVASFLLLKWQTMKRPYYIHFFVNFLMTIAIILHAVLRFTKIGNPFCVTFMMVAVWIGCAYMGIIELIQLCYRRLAYFSTFSTLLSWVIIILCLLSSLELGLALHAARTMAVYAIFLAAIKFTSLLGSLPWGNVSTHMLIFSKLFWTYIQSFIFFSTLIVAFSFSFFILFSQDANESFHTFSNISSVFIKTIIIATGEYNAGEYPFANIFDYIYFGIFVITVSLVIFNLMSGLAFGETQEIRAQAKVNGSICRIRLLRQFEIFLEQPHSCWERFLSVILKPLLGQNLSVIKLIITPNQKIQVHAELETVFHRKPDSRDLELKHNLEPKIKALHDFVLDKKIVNRARAIVHKK